VTLPTILHDFIDTVRFDVVDANYSLSSERMALLESTSASLPKPGIATRLTSYFVALLRSLAPNASTAKNCDWYAKDLLISFTLNQREVLRSVRGEDNESKSLWMGRHPSPDLSMTRSYLIGALFVPRVILRYLASTGYRRRSYLYGADQYLLAYGWYFQSVRLLRRHRPRAVILSNDHAVLARTTLRVAQRLAIPTIYVQHASVTERFPPLEFDFALLDGRDALEKYAAAGASRTRVYLMGMPKFDRHTADINHQETVNSVGLCTSPFDPIERVLHLAAVLRVEQSWLKVYLRPHPKDQREVLWQQLAKSHGFEFSNPEREPVFDFLRRCDAIIAGDSGIHLEAAILNVYPLYYDFMDRAMDWYGFLKHGLLDERYSDPHAMLRRLHDLRRQRPNIRSRAGRYDATVGTRYDGRSGELGRRLIRSLVSGGVRNEIFWKRIHEVNTIEAYEPDPMLEWRDE
jgi:hypothetical protein